MKRSSRIVLTVDMIEDFKVHAARTGLGPYALLRGASDKPAGLSAATINSWLNKSAASARQDYYDYVLQRWQSQGAVCPRIALTADIIGEIEHHWLRTDVSLARLVKWMQPIPPGFNVRLLRACLDGRIQTARADHIAAVISTLRGLPDRGAYLGRPRL